MINVGICGCGAIAKHRHTPEYAQNAAVRIAGYYDPVKPRALALAAQYGGRVYDSPADLFADADIDAVSICAPNTHHAAYTVNAAKEKKHVLCEKPMATTAAECEAMIAAAKENGVKLMIAQNQRLAPAHVTAKQLLQNGDIGDVLTFRTIFGHSGPENWCADCTAETWFFNREEAFTGSLGDLGVHKIDLLRWLFNAEVCAVQAVMKTMYKQRQLKRPVDVEDNAIALLEFDNHAVGTLAASWTCFGEEVNSTSVYGTQGVLQIYTRLDFPLVLVKKDGTQVLYRLGGVTANKEQRTTGIIDAFISAIRDDTPPPVSGEDGYKTIKSIFAIIEAAKTGRRVYITP